MSLKLTCTRKQSLINAAQSSASAESKQNTVLQHNSEIIKQQLCTIGELTQKIEALRAQRAREEEVLQALSSRKQALGEQNSNQKKEDTESAEQQEDT